MKIGIDARMLGQGFGLARYIQQLVLNLENADDGNQYVLFMRKSNWDEYVPKNPNFIKVLADIPWYSFEEQVRLVKTIKQEKVDLMHFPHWNVPLMYGDPFVVTIHDLTMFKYPRPEATTLGPVKFWIKDKIHRLVVKRAMKRAVHVITTTEFTKQDVHNTLGVSLDKMTVIYQAPCVQEGGGNLDKPGVKRPYVMYVGAAYPHKNLEGLLKAWKIFKESDWLDHKLILVGKKDYFYQKLLDADLFSDSVVYTDFVPDNELVELYKYASLYVFPSLYEGFGLPPLEAMQYGVPVVSSSASCLPEVLGEAALYFDPENYEQMAEMIKIGVGNEEVRHQLMENAKDNLNRFSKKSFVEKTLSIYHEAGS